MFAFAPYNTPSQFSPRERYFAALAEARSAETEYVAALAREKAIQKQREEEQRRKVVLQRQATHRQLHLEEALYSTPYYLADDFYPQSNPFDLETEEEVALIREVERRRALVRRQRQEEFERRQRLVILHQQQQERERAQAIAAARHAQEVKRRELQARLSHRSKEEEVLRFLFGEHAVIRKEPPQQKLVLCQPERVAPPQGCESHCAPRHQAIKTEQDDIQQFLKLIFGGASDATGSQCCCAHKEEVKAKAVQNPLDYQDQRQPTVSRPATQVPTTVPAASASRSSGPSLKDKLRSRLNDESESEVRDAVKDLFSSIFGPGAKLERKERVEKRHQDSKSHSTSDSSSSGLSLKEQLEARLHKDPNVEVHDTIQAILASLAPTQHSQDGPASTSTKDVKPKADVSVSSAPAAESKGKGKAVSFDVPTTTNPTSKDVVDSMKAIHNIQAAFNRLSADFTFPTRLDFTPPSSTPSSPQASDSESASTSQLAYTSTNAPVRYYEQALSALLSQLDAVESWGNGDVRKERKEIVARVEAALEEVEKEVQERFVHRQVMKTGSVLVEAKEAIVEKVQSDEAPVAEVVQAAVPADIATAAAAEAVEEPTTVDDVSTSSDHQSTDTEVILTAESETVPPLASSDEQRPDSPVKDISVSAPAPLERDVVASPEQTEDSSLVNSVATVTNADKNTTDAVETSASSEQHSSYPPASLTSEVSAVTEPASPTPSTQADTEAVDTFLLPATTESPVIPKRPAVNEEDEMVLIDKEHGEASDGENWSEVEA